MNHFFALTVPDDARRHIAERAAAWKELIPPAFAARWYESEDYHVTLKFMGEIDSARQINLVRAALSVAAQTPTVRVATMRGFGAFPNKRSPRVLWAGIIPDPALIALAAHLDEAVQTLGFKREVRAFFPHITLARCRPAPDKTLLPMLPALPGGWEVSFRADQFHLMQTLPPQQGLNGLKARYNIVHTFPFGSTA